MLVWTLIVLNIPVYLLLGWLIFDTKDTAAYTFWGTIVAILQIILVPRPIRMLLGWDDDGAWGIFPVAAFFGASAAVIYGEYWVITNYFTG